MARQIITKAEVLALLNRRGLDATPSAHLADITLAAVTGVDGVGSNAASKADVDTRLALVQTKINAIIDILEAGKLAAAA